MINERTEHSGLGEKAAFAASKIRDTVKSADWEFRRKRAFRKDFARVGIKEEDTEKAIGVIEFLERNTEVNEYSRKQIGLTIKRPYRYYTEDTPSIKKLVEEIPNPIALLQAMEAVIDWKNLGYSLNGKGALRNLAEYIGIVGKDERVIGFLQQLKTVGTLSKVKSYELPKKDPLGPVLALSGDEYQKVTAQETFQRMKALRETFFPLVHGDSRRDIAESGDYGEFKGPLLAEHIADYLFVCQNQSRYEVFITYLGKSLIYSSSPNWFPQELANKFAALRQLINQCPELVQLHESGFNIAHYISKGEYRGLNLQDQADLQKLAGNSRMCANAKLLARFGIRIYAEEAASVDNEFYATTDPERMETILMIWDQFGKRLGFYDGEAALGSRAKDIISLYNTWAAVSPNNERQAPMKEVYEALLESPDFSLASVEWKQEWLTRQHPIPNPALLTLKALTLGITDKTEIMERISTLKSNPSLLMAIYDREFMSVFTNDPEERIDDWFRVASDVTFLFENRSVLPEKLSYFAQNGLSAAKDLNLYKILVTMDSDDVKRTLLMINVGRRINNQWQPINIHVELPKLEVTKELFTRAAAVEGFDNNARAQMSELFIPNYRYPDLWEFSALTLFRLSPEALDVLRSHTGENWDRFSSIVKKLRILKNSLSIPIDFSGEILLCDYLNKHPKDMQTVENFITVNKVVIYQSRNGTPLYDSHAKFNILQILVVANIKEPSFVLADYIDANGSAKDPLLYWFASRKDNRTVDDLLTPRTVDQLLEEKRQFWQVWKSVENPQLKDFFVSNRESLSIEELQTYADIWNRIDKSPSQEIKRVRNEIVSTILGVDDPLKSYLEIETIFVRNTLPLVHKTFKVFDILHPDKVLTRQLAEKNYLSPVLQTSTPEERKQLILQDLFGIHIRSGNRPLRDYITELASEARLFLKFGQKDLAGISPEEKAQLNQFFDRMNALSQPLTNKAKRAADHPELSTLETKFTDLHQQLGTLSEQILSSRIAQMLTQSEDFQSPEDILEEMRSVKQQAHKRGLQYAAEAADGYLSFQAGDLIKGVLEEYIGNINQNGSVAKEYLGGAAKEDTTPFDTDVSLVLPQDLEGKIGLDQFKQVLEKSEGGKGSFGNLLFVFRDRGQFNFTSLDSCQQLQGKYELFNSGGTYSGRHHGIRTGIPSTEIDFMVATKTLINNRKDLDNVFYTIAQNGFYIPVVDSDGKIIFTPQIYDKFRHTFEGLSIYDGDPISIIDTAADSQVNRLAIELRRENQRIHSLSQRIKTTVEEVLRDNEIKLRDDIATGIIGAELYDIGSTGRHTNVPGDSDFDLTLILDDIDKGKIEDIKLQIIQRFGAKKEAIHIYTRPNESQQLQLKEVVIDGNALSVDIGFAKKSDLRVFGSHDAVADKLQWIKSNLGEDTYFNVLANIVLAKQILKAGKAYKKLEDGGLGGIGIENWILANGGSFRQSAESFYDSAIGPDGHTRSLEEFKREYRIYDGGTNILFFSNDEFIDRNLTEGGYKRMLESIKKYLGR